MIRATGVAAVLLAAGVTAAGAEDRGKEPAGSPSAFTLGLVQRELRAGLSQAEVVERLGAPNILTRDAGGHEAWVYDRVSSDVEVSGGSVGLGGLGSAAGGSVAGLLGLTAGKRSERVEANVNVTPEAAGARVRVSLVTRVTEKNGTVRSVRPVDDPQAYQSLLARLDKAVYLQREGL